MKSNYLLFLIIILFSISNYANRGKIKIKQELSVKKADNMSSSDVPDKWVRNNELLVIMQKDFPSYIQDIAYKIGNNSRLEIDQNVIESMKNFDLVFTFSCIPDETTEPLSQGPHAGTVAEYAFYLYIDLIDPYSTNKIIGSYSVKQVFVSDALLSGEEQADYAKKLFSDDALPDIERIESDIIKMADYHKATIQYFGNTIADGETKGEIKISNIFKKLIGEAPKNKISTFELRCEKGTFLKTNSQKIRFDGNEYFHRYNSNISFAYQTYNCSQYDDNKSDTFTLVQISRFNENIDEKIVQTEEIKFNCSTYNVYAHYYCPDFADAEVVWEDVKIVIPQDKTNIQVIDASTFEEDESPDITVPYAVNIPGYGKEYYFSECENAVETPKELKMESLQGGICFMDRGEDALNMLSIEITPEHPNVFRLVLQFDMYIGESRENSLQMTVGTDSEFPGPTEFYWAKLDEDIVKKLQAGEDAQKTLINQAGCKLIISFVPN